MTFVMVCIASSMSPDQTGQSDLGLFSLIPVKERLHVSELLVGSIA